MQTMVRKLGNSAGVIIPKPLLSASPRAMPWSARWRMAV